MKVCAVEDAYSGSEAEEKRRLPIIISVIFSEVLQGESVCFIHQIPSRQSPNIHAGDTWPVARGIKDPALQSSGGIKLEALQSSGYFDPRGSRQISMQAWILGSLLAGINYCAMAQG